MEKIDNTPKPTYFLLHGWGGTTKSLLKLEELINSNGFTVYNLEYPGFGELVDIDKVYSMKDYGQWLKEQVESRVNDNNYVLVGHSFGGKIILETLIQKLLSPKHAVLIDASGIKPQNTLKKILLNVVSRTAKVLPVKPIRKIFYKFIVREADYLKLSGNLKETFKIVINEHYNDKLGNISCPVLIIWGAEDKVTPVYMAEKLKNGIAKSKLYILKDKGHSLPIRFPEEVLTILSNEIK